MMNSMLQSSLYGHDFIKYRKNNNEQIRKNFSNSVKTTRIDELPVVIDSIDPILSKLISGTEKRYNNNGKEYHFHKDLTIGEVLLEIKLKIKFDNTKNIKIGLENGKILEESNILGTIYNKFKNQKDDILYLIITQEITMYGYILSLLRYIFGENFMK